MGRLKMYAVGGKRGLSLEKKDKPFVPLQTSLPLLSPVALNLTVTLSPVC